MLNLDTAITINAKTMKSPNLASEFSRDDLARLGAWVRDGFDKDL